MSKNDSKINKLNKYDIDANIQEVDNSDDKSVFKYEFTALSDPKNVRLAIEGIANISGDTLERNEMLSEGENNVPKILTLIYHELFPTFFLLSKSLNVSCPPHIIGQNTSTVSDSLEESPQTESPQTESPQTESPQTESPQTESITPTV